MQEHAKEVAKIKAAKETAEALQLQVQRNMKEEMERLKTQFTFKVSRLHICASFLVSHTAGL